MSDIEYRWSNFLSDYMAAHPNADWEEVERDRLDGCMFDADDPYIVALAIQVLDEVRDDFYEEEEQEVRDEACGVVA